MAPGELVKIWGLVCEQVREAEQMSLALPSQAPDSSDEDAAAGSEPDFDSDPDPDPDPESDAASESELDLDAPPSADEPAGFRLPWLPRALEAQYRAYLARVRSGQ